MKKLNREAVAKYTSRFFLVLMNFMLILSLCSMASPSGEVELIIQNPDNIPQDYTIDYYTLDGGMDEVGKPLSFGSNTAFGFLSNGSLEGEQLVPFGNYAFIYVVGENLIGGTALTCNGTVYNPIPDISLSCYVTDNPVITVTDDYAEDVSGLFIFVPIETPTSSITSVWTSITNWVMSSLNTVQGVFYGAGQEVFTPDTSSSDTIEYNGVTYYPIDSSYSDNGYPYLNGVEIPVEDVTQTGGTINGTSYDIVQYNGNPLCLINSDTGIVYSPVGFELVVPIDGSLTLLGTLAVIGVSISIAFLVIGVISRFLKFRG